MAAASNQVSDETESKVTVSCTAEYKDYVYNENHDIWGLISLVAPNREENQEEKERAAMDIVAVLDKSGSMAGEKLKLVKLAMEFFLTQLSSKDRLSIVTYDSNIKVNFGLMKMTKDNKKIASNKIKQITQGTCTNLSGGLLTGMCQIIDRPSQGKNDVASVLLFTDGLANEGIQNVNGIIDAMKDPKKYVGPGLPETEPMDRNNPQAPAPHTSWLQRIYAGSQKKPAASPPSPAPSVINPTKGCDASVYCFGFGADHNSEMLRQISDAGTGMYYFIENEDKIGDSFAHCLGGLMSTVAQQIQMEVRTEDGVKIKDVHTTRPYEKQSDQSIKVNIGDLQAEEQRDIVLELSLDSVSAPYDTTPQCVLTTETNYFNVVSNNLESTSGSLYVLRPETATEHDETNVNPRIAKEKIRMETSKVMAEAGQLAAQYDYEGSKGLLDAHIGKMKNSRITLESNLVCDRDILTGIDEEYDAMIEDCSGYQANVVSESTWRSHGQQQQMNLCQQYDRQRCAGVETNAYKSKSRESAIKKSKSFFSK